MVRKSNTAGQIINKLREAEILLGQGATVGEASRKRVEDGAHVRYQIYVSCFSLCDYPVRSPI